MNKLITIFKANSEEERIKLHIERGSYARYTLANEDYVMLNVVTPKPVSFAYGDYIRVNETRKTPTTLAVDLAMTFGEEVDEYAFDERLHQILSGIYKVVNASMPTYDQRTGGYKYQLRLDAWYMQMSHYIFMLPYIGTDKSVTRREAEFSLTDKIEQHVALLILNMVALGVNYQGESVKARVDFRKEGKYLYYADIYFDETSKTVKVVKDKIISNAPSSVYVESDTKYITYAKSNIISAIGQIATEWECDWWFEEGTLRLGRRESLSTATHVEIGTHCASISSSNATKDFATRLFVYGSTRNIPYAYRKKIIFTSSREGNNIWDDSKPVSPAWFSKRNTNISKSGKIEKQNTLDFFPERSRLLTWNGNDLLATPKTQPSQGTSGVSVTYRFLSSYGGAPFSTDEFPQGTVVRYRLNRATSFYKGDFRLNMQVKVSSEEATWIYNEGTYYDPINNVGISHFESSEWISQRLSSRGPITVSILPGATDTNVVMIYDIDVEVVETSNYLSAKAKAKIQTIEGIVEEDVVINPLGVSYNSEFSHIIEVVGGTPFNPKNYPQGTKYELSDIILTKIPSSYITSDDVSAVNNKIADTRLRMPHNDFVDIAENLTEDEIIEEARIIEDVYPHQEDYITEVGTINYTEDYTDPQTGNTEKRNWNAYKFKGNIFSAEFSNDYKIEGEDIKVNFITGSLAGMTFVVEYNKQHEGEAYKPEVNKDGSRNEDATWFEIIANEDYGLRFPNENLKPERDDIFTIVGYDTSYMATDITERAEQELESRAKVEAAKQVHNQSTYELTMLPSWLEENNLPKIGDKLNFDTGNYFEPIRDERIIGYEIPLDIPTDHPKFTCGESPKYSRLKTIESKMKKT